MHRRSFKPGAARPISIVVVLSPGDRSFDPTGSSPAPDRDDPAENAWLILVYGIALTGAVVLASSLIEASHQPLGLNVLLLAALTVATNRLAIRVPGQPSVVPIAQIFVFTSILLFGPAVTTITVALDGFCTSLLREGHGKTRMVFASAEPAISAWVAGQLFFVIAGTGPLFGTSQPGVLLVLPTTAMAVTYFGINSWLTAAADGVEARQSVVSIWRARALFLLMTVYATASLGAFVAANSAMLGFDVLGLVAPLMILVYVTYTQFSNGSADRDRHAHDLERLYEATIETLAVAVDAKDQVTHGHIRRVQRHAVALARALGLSDPMEMKALEAAALLHDIGKLAVPDYVLNKPGSLTGGEFEIMKMHAERGARILAGVSFPYPVVPMVKHHHEQWNGQGYPDAIAGDRIPIGARILSVVDCFDALTSDRPYRRKLSDEAAVEMLRARSAVFYDPDIVRAFVALIPQLRAEDRQVEPTWSTSAVAREPGPAVPSVLEGTCALKVDLITPDAVGKLLRVRLSRLLPDAEFCLFIPDPDNEWLMPVHASAALRPPLGSVHLRVGEGLSGWVAVNRHTIINSYPDLDLPQAASALGLQRCVCTPVFAFGTIAGVLTVYTRQAAGFSDREIRLVGAIAQELGVEFTRHDRTLGCDLAALDDAAPLASAG